MTRTDSRKSDVYKSGPTQKPHKTCPALSNTPMFRYM